ncbi:MAG: 3-hydroxy-3-methylglutaryl-CoA reductase, partial [Candidatus Diapherotrites archaeon]|nr:3-hydroxy-3-methylglutaryl-CoA reductase [Candidatus Diapherotrites archaeon]
QDFRALEAGAHAYAWYKEKTYKPLSRYSKDKDGNLVGEIELPLAVGLVGGAIKTHPVARVSVKLLKVKTAQELAQIFAAVGLAQNFAALRALATEGIQKGHMKLHAKNIAVAGGAKGERIDEVAAQLIREGNIRQARAEELVKEFPKNDDKWIYAKRG